MPVPVVLDEEAVTDIVATADGDREREPLLIVGVGQVGLRVRRPGRVQEVVVLEVAPLALPTHPTDWRLESGDAESETPVGVAGRRAHLSGLRHI